jgi:hypothetical protein
MGLDMYLNVRKYVSQTDWSRIGEYREQGYDKAPDNPEYKLLVEEFGLDGLVDNAGHGGGYITMTAVYWRKANAIHQWFVDNCADGVDDCKPVWVSEEKLEELYDIVCKVLANPYDQKVAEELLPTQSGFFFGATEYGDWYWEDLEYTRDSLKNLLDTHKEKSTKDGRDVSIDFEYSASW